MALYRTSLRMAHDVTFSQRRKWSNTFYVEAPNATAAAAAVAVGWESALRGGVRANIFAYEVYATDLLPGTEDYDVVTIPSGLARGTIGLQASQNYLLKACLGVVLRVSGSRPSRKFWRCGLNELDVVDGVSVGGTIIDLVENAFGEFLVEMGGALRDPDGQPFEDVGRIYLTTREFGRTAGYDVPEAPPVG